MAATLKDVAQRAGVSIRTVTRVLKDEPGSNARTRRLVRRAADTLGYIPNAAARALKTRRSAMVGLMVSPFKVDVPVRERILLHKLLESEGKFFLSGLLPDREAGLCDLLKEWSGWVQDVIFLSWPDAFRANRALAGLPMRFLFVNCLDEPGCDTVLTDRSAGIRDGVGWLLDSGRRRVARCGSDTTSRRQGFDAAFAAGAGSVRAEKREVRTRGLEFQDGYAAGAAIREQGIDAVFFETDRMAFGFYRYAHEHGLRIPEDVAVIGFDDEPAGAYACPPLSTVAHPLEAIARDVAARLRAPGAPPRRAVFPTRFVRRESC